MAKTDEDKCPLCNKVFRGSVNSIQIRKAQHLGGGWCKGVKGND